MPCHQLRAREPCVVRTGLLPAWPGIRSSSRCRKTLRLLLLVCRRRPAMASSRLQSLHEVRQLRRACRPRTRRRRRPDVADRRPRPVGRGGSGRPRTIAAPAADGQGKMQAIKAAPPAGVTAHAETMVKRQPPLADSKPPWGPQPQPQPQPQPEAAGAAADSAADASRPTLAIGGEAVEFAVAGFGPQAARLGPTAAAAAEPLLADSDLTNLAELAGKVAVVRRGGCKFLAKARRAQAAGAVAMDDGHRGRAVTDGRSRQSGWRHHHPLHLRRPGRRRTAAAGRQQRRRDACVRQTPWAAAPTDRLRRQAGGQGSRQDSRRGARPARGC